MTNTIANVQLITIFEAVKTYGGYTKEVLQNIADTNVFVNDHDDRIVTIDGDKIALLILEGTNGIEYVCPAYRNTVFCMNPLFIKAKTGYVHLSTGSVAGNIRRSNSINHLVELCNDYNEQSVCGPKIKAVIEL